MATVATDPSASREATMPAAMSIWLSTHPPKIWPLALMSPGRGTTRRIASRMSGVVPSFAASAWAVASVVIPFSQSGVFVVAGTARQEHQAHQPGAHQHGETDAQDRRDLPVHRHRTAETLQGTQRGH